MLTPTMVFFRGALQQPVFSFWITSQCACQCRSTAQWCHSLLSTAQVAIKHIPKQTNIQDLLLSRLAARHSLPAACKTRLAAGGFHRIVAFWSMSSTKSPAWTRCDSRSAAGCSILSVRIGHIGPCRFDFSILMGQARKIRFSTDVDFPVGEC